MTQAAEKRGGKFLDLLSLYCAMQENRKIFRNLNPTVLQQTRCIRCSHTAVKMLSEVHEANLFQRAPTS